MASGIACGLIARSSPAALDRRLWITIALAMTSVVASDVAVVRNAQSFPWTKVRGSGVIQLVLADALYLVASVPPDTRLNFAAVAARAVLAAAALSIACTGSATARAQRARHWLFAALVIEVPSWLLLRDPWGLLVVGFTAPIALGMVLLLGGRPPPFVGG